MAYDPYSSNDYNPYAPTSATPATTHSHRPAELKHSGVGIASFILSLFSAFVLFVLVVIAGVMQASTPGGMDEESPEAIALGLGLIGFMFASFGAFVMGLAGIFQSQRKKIFPILGTIFSGMTLLGVLGLMVLGAAMG